MNKYEILNAASKKNTIFDMKVYLKFNAFSKKKYAIKYNFTKSRVVLSYKKKINCVRGANQKRCGFQHRMGACPFV